MSDRNNTELVQGALTIAVCHRGKIGSVIVHSDQGSTYASGDYQKLMKERNL